MHYANIKTCDIANGTGVRTSLFVSGCTHHCPGCFNAEAWDFGYGAPFDETVEAEIFASLAPSYISGLTLLGGEPMEPENLVALLPFLKRFKEKYPNKTLWCYSGYTFETLVARHCPATDGVLALLDVLVDGRFVEALYDISLKFRGSSNQRLIDVQQSLAEGTVIYYQP